jgi:signal transduction histidine kinase
VVTAFLPGRQQGVWIGTDTGLVLRASGGKVNRAPGTEALAGKAVMSFCEDQSGRLWIGTAGRGLACLQASKLTLWGAAQGLPDELVYGVVDDSEGNLWLLTGKGVCRMERVSTGRALEAGGKPKVNTIFEHLSEAGDPDRSSGGQRALRAQDGRLWFATSEGVLAVDPGGNFGEQSAPPVRLEAVLVNNRKLGLEISSREPGDNDAPKPVTVPARLWALELRFTALNLTAAEKVRFRHKLEGSDADWVDTGSERRVSYGRLLSGRYRFLVTASNSNGVWNSEPAEFAFIVPTPLWRTPWMLVLYGMTATGVVVGVVRVVSHRRLRRKLAHLQQQQAMERERVRIAQDMHDEIGSKLTKISFLSERAKVELRETGAVATKIDSIAHTSRELLRTLDEIVWAVNPRNDTLEHLAAYLAQYAAEYFQNTPVECNLHLQGELPRQSMSAEVRHNLFLAFEESLNNVLKHSGGSQVHVDIQVQHRQFTIAVKDNGRGFNLTNAADAGQERARPGRGPGGNGLPNMRERLADIGGLCEIQSSPGKGVTVHLSIPLDSTRLQLS